MTKRITIVDNEDKTIGSKEKESLTSKDIYRVAILWITNSKSQILLSKRELSKDHSSSKWGPAVAETLENGETYYSNIIKCAKEDLGLTNIYPVRGEKERIKGKNNYFMQWHFLTINKDAKNLKINKEKVEKLKWFTKEALSKEFKKNPEQFSDSVKSMR